MGCFRMTDQGVIDAAAPQTEDCTSQEGGEGYLLLYLYLYRWPGEKVDAQKYKTNTP